MQHEVFANPAPRIRAAFPFIAVLQADLSAEGRSRMIAPMAPRAAGRLLPVVRHDGRAYLLAVELMTSLPISVLRNPVSSIVAHRDDIARAIDWLFTGV